MENVTMQIPLSKFMPHTKQQGASLVEFIVVGPVAFLLVLGIIQTGFMYMAKMTLNNATFMAARQGAVNHAIVSKPNPLDVNEPDGIRDSLIKGLIPFYQNSTNPNDLTRTGSAWAAAILDGTKLPFHDYVKLEVLSPNNEAFTTFGLNKRVGATNVRYIPNDNLEYRNLNTNGSTISIRDANILRIKVTYAYELKVPLIASMLKRVMCGGYGGPSAFGNIPIWQKLGTVDSCLNYYEQGRTPIVSFATVQMQSEPRR
jgi:TadE-like protein